MFLLEKFLAQSRTCHQQRSRPQETQSFALRFLESLGPGLVRRTQSTSRRRRRFRPTLHFPYLFSLGHYPTRWEWEWHCQKRQKCHPEKSQEK